MNYSCITEMNKEVANLFESTGEHGFDLTDFNSPEDWKRIIKELKITPTPKWNKGTGHFIWKGPGIMIVTANDPISGKYGQEGRRKDEKGYASYIGIEGDVELVKKAAELIRKYGSSKDESPGRRDFI
jgi:hypothetical protein